MTRPLKCLPLALLLLWRPAPVFAQVFKYVAVASKVITDTVKAETKRSPNHIYGMDGVEDDPDGWTEENDLISLDCGNSSLEIAGIGKFILVRKDKDGERYNYDREMIYRLVDNSGNRALFTLISYKNSSKGFVALYYHNLNYYLRIKKLN